jgi:hypothetical protein
MGFASVLRLQLLFAGIGLLAFTTLMGGTTMADEGMWLFNQPPKKHLKEKYGFDATDSWMEHLQKASVRFNSGGSGSFVSSEGLVITNHHVGADALQKLSSKDHDYIKTGFYAKTRDDEVKCLDLELNVLMSIEDVTDRVDAAVKADASMADAEKARRAVMNDIEQESLQKTGLRSDVITLYNGGKYNLYRFKKYTDVRLVFAPEMAAAFFGGDPDNFEYPRYDLDICFFRVYENGKPAKPEHFLEWCHTGLEPEELVFVSGHPGKTDRMDTVHHLEYMRDLAIPFLLQWVMRQEVLLKNYADRSGENLRRAQEDIFALANGRKAQVGRLAGLQDPEVIRAKQVKEDALRAAVNKDPQLRAACGNAWNEIDAALKTLRMIRKRFVMLEEGRAFRSHQFMIARTLVRMAEEDKLPSAQRLREYRTSNRESLEQMLFSEAPIYDDLETLKLADGLSFWMTEAGADDPLVVKVLAGKSPRDRAAEIIAGTKLKDVSVRRELASGGFDAIAASQDAMIELARMVDEPARRVRKTFEQDVEEPLRQAYAKIAKAEFAIHGTDVYPDATFTLRLSFGVVRGYKELGKEIPAWTDIAGAFERSAEHKNQEPFNLPPRWIEGKSKLKLDTPMNFVSTADIIGGNSGSPVVNRKAEFVGIIFDGNIESLVWDFAYTDVQGRAVSVHAAAIEETLRKLYGAAPLADELGR